jgi:Ulp1 family protease
LADVKKADEARPEGEKIAPLVHSFNSFFYKKLSTAKWPKEDKEADN